MLSITLLIILTALCIFIAVKFSELRFAFGIILIFLIVFLINSLFYERYRIPIGYFGILPSINMLSSECPSGKNYFSKQRTYDLYSITFPNSNIIVTDAGDSWNIYISEEGRSIKSLKCQ